MASTSTTTSTGAGGDEFAFDLGLKLRQRLHEANEQRERTQAKINALSDSLQRMFSRAPKKPRETMDQMNSKIEKLEFRRTTQSLSLSAEKQILREIEVIKKQKKILEEYHVHEHAIQEKKNEISGYRDSLRTVSAAIAELESALSKVELAKRLGCTTAELQTRVVDCPSDKIGHIIGKNGSSLKQLEDRTGVQIDVDKIGSKIHLQGSVAALDAAVMEVEQITLAVEEEIELFPAVVAYFLAQRSAVLNKVQQSHPRVHFDLSRNSNTLTLRGLPQYISSAKDDILSLDIKTATRNLSTREIGFVVGKGGATVNRLVVDHNVSVNVSNEPPKSKSKASSEPSQAVVEVTGPAANIEAALTEIESIIYQNEEIEEYVMIEPMQRNIFLANSGAVVKEIQSEITSGSFGALLVFEKRKDDIKEPSKLCIRTSRCNMMHALQTVQKHVADFEASVVSMSVDPDMIPAVIGKGGATINSLRQPGVEIEIDKLSGLIKIQADDEEVKQSIQNSIHLIVAENQVKNITVEKNMIGLIFGESGKQLKKTITDEIGVWMGIDSTDEHIILRGTVENIDKAADILQTFIEQNYTEEVDVLPEDDAVLFHAGDENIMNKIEKQHSVSLNYKKSSNRVIVRGRQENVTEAVKVLHAFLYGGGEDGFIVYKIKIPESAIGIVIGKGGSHIAKLEKDFEGVTVDLLRGTNRLSIRGPEDKVKQCRSDVISLVSTAKVSEIIPLSENQYAEIMKSNVVKKCADCKTVQLLITENSIKLRGTNNDVKDAKAIVMEQITGVFKSSIELEMVQFNKLVKAFRDQTHFDRIQESTKANVSLDTEASAITISGKRASVKKAKNQLFGVLDFLLPGEFTRIKIAKPMLAFMSDATFLAKASADSGASVTVDRELICVLVRSDPNAETDHAIALVNARIGEYEKLNYVVRLDPTDSWILPKIIGKGGATIQKLQRDSECTVDVYREEMTVVVSGETPESVQNAKASLDKIIEQARRECVFIDIPDSAMAAFIGKSGSNIRNLADYHSVDIERIRNQSRVRVYGDEVSVLEAKTAILNWLKDWESRNVGKSISVDESLMPAVLRRQRSICDTVQRQTGCKADIDRKSCSITVRGGDRLRLANAMVLIENVVDEERKSMEELNAEKEKAMQEAKTAMDRKPNETVVTRVEEPLVEDIVQTAGSIDEVVANFSNDTSEPSIEVATSTEVIAEPSASLLHTTPVASEVDKTEVSNPPVSDQPARKSTKDKKNKPSDGTSFHTAPRKETDPNATKAGKDLFQLLVSDSSMSFIPKATVKSTSAPPPMKQIIPSSVAADEQWDGSSTVTGSTGTDTNDEASTTNEAPQKPYYKSSSGFVVRV